MSKLTPLLLTVVLLLVLPTFPIDPIDDSVPVTPSTTNSSLPPTAAQNDTPTTSAVVGSTTRTNTNKDGLTDGEVAGITIGALALGGGIAAGVTAGALYHVNRKKEIRAQMAATAGNAYGQGDAYGRGDIHRQRDSSGQRMSQRHRDSSGQRMSLRQRDNSGERMSYRQRDSSGEREDYRQRDSSEQRMSYRQRDSSGEKMSYRQRDSSGQRDGFRKGAEGGEQSSRLKERRTKQYEGRDEGRSKYQRKYGQQGREYTRQDQRRGQRRQGRTGKYQRERGRDQRRQDRQRRDQSATRRERQQKSVSFKNYGRQGLSRTNQKMKGLAKDLSKSLSRSFSKRAMKQRFRDGAALFQTKGPRRSPIQERQQRRQRKSPRSKSFPAKLDYPRQKVHYDVPSSLSSQSEEQYRKHQEGIKGLRTRDPRSPMSSSSDDDETQERLKAKFSRLALSQHEQYPKQLKTKGGLDGYRFKEVKSKGVHTIHVYPPQPTTDIDLQREKLQLAKRQQQRIEELEVQEIKSRVERRKMQDHHERELRTKELQMRDYYQRQLEKRQREHMSEISSLERRKRRSERRTVEHIHMPMPMPVHVPIPVPVPVPVPMYPAQYPPQYRSKTQQRIIHHHHIRKGRQEKSSSSASSYHRPPPFKHSQQSVFKPPRPREPSPKQEPRFRPVSPKLPSIPRFQQQRSSIEQPQSPRPQSPRVAVPLPHYPIVDQEASTRQSIINLLPYQQGTYPSFSHLTLQQLQEIRRRFRFGPRHVSSTFRRYKDNYNAQHYTPKKLSKQQWTTQQRYSGLYMDPTIDHRYWTYSGYITYYEGGYSMEIPFHFQSSRALSWEQVKAHRVVEQIYAMAQQRLRYQMSRMSSFSKGVQFKSSVHSHRMFPGSDRRHQQQGWSQYLYFVWGTDQLTRASATFKLDSQSQVNDRTVEEFFRGSKAGRHICQEMHRNWIEVGDGQFNCDQVTFHISLIGVNGKMATTMRTVDVMPIQGSATGMGAGPMKLGVRFALLQNNWKEDPVTIQGLDTSPYKGTYLQDKHKRQMESRKVEVERKSRERVVGGGQSFHFTSQSRVSSGNYFSQLMQNRPMREGRMGPYQNRRYF